MRLCTLLTGGAAVPSASDNDLESLIGSIPDDVCLDR
jgi:hypothetical protein